LQSLNLCELNVLKLFTKGTGYGGYGTVNT